MGVSSKTLQHVVHELKLIRYSEKFNAQNQRTFELEKTDIENLISLKTNSGAKNWKTFLTIFSDRPQIKIYSTKIIHEIDPQILNKILR